MIMLLCGLFIIDLSQLQELRDNFIRAILSRHFPKMITHAVKLSQDFLRLNSKLHETFQIRNISLRASYAFTR